MKSDMKRNIIFAAAALAALAVEAGAQNLDPTVEVSRAYEGKLMEVHKPVLDMAVPDTIHRFDLDFDYAVSESPYRGSYEFNPYMMSMKPTSSRRKPGTFYLNAGAGYTLHPVVDAVWSPSIGKENMSLDVYAFNRSYVGDYYSANGAGDWFGYDFLSKAGTSYRLGWSGGTFRAGAGYYGVALKDCFKSRMYDAVDVDLSVASVASSSSRFLYALNLKYRFAEDKLKDHASGDYLSEHNFRFDALLGPTIGKHKILVDLGVEYDMYSGDVDAGIGEVAVVPRYVYEKGGLKMDLGLRFSLLMLKNSAETIWGSSGQLFYPDVRVSYALAPTALKDYAVVGGGNRINTYASMIDRDHHFSIGYDCGISPLLDVTLERVSAVIGLEGRIGAAFSYDFRAGYANYAGAPMAAVVDVDGVLMPAVGYSAFQKWFAALEWNLDMERVRFDGSALYTDTWDYDRQVFIAPAALSGDASFVYNWKERIFAGVDCEWALGRSSAVYSVPWYADLGVYAEYEAARRMSFWLRAGNLLDMNIQRDLLFAEKGLSFTAGIKLKI